MTDSKTPREPGDLSRINANDEFQLQYWSERFNVSGRELKAAIGRVGPMVEDVKEEIERGG